MDIEARWRKYGLIGKINTPEEAIRVSRECGKAFFVVAAIQGIIGAWLFPMLLVDAALFASLGFWLFKGQSRIAAVLLVMIGTFSLVSTCKNIFGSGPPLGGANILVAVLILWCATRATQATFILARMAATPTKPV